MSPGKVYSKAEVEFLKRERLSRWATILAVAGLTTATATFIGGFSTVITDKNFADAFGVSRLRETEKLAAENVAIKEQVTALRREVASLRPATGVTPTSAEVAKLEEAVSELTKRQNRIEDAISRDPARALELPLLRRDLDNIKESQAQAAESMSQRINQVFDLNKWLLGGGAISLLAIALSILLSRLKPRVEP